MVFSLFFKRFFYSLSLHLKDVMWKYSQFSQCFQKLRASSNCIFLLYILSLMFPNKLFQFT